MQKQKKRDILLYKKYIQQKEKIILLIHLLLKNCLKNIYILNNMNI